MTLMIEARNGGFPVLAELAQAIRFDDEDEMFDLLSAGHDCLRWINPAALGGEAQWQELVAEAANAGWKLDQFFNESHDPTVNVAVVVLSNNPGAVVTRDMLYAAVTRTSNALVIVASRTALRRAFDTPDGRADLTAGKTLQGSINRSSLLATPSPGEDMAAQEAIPLKPYYVYVLIDPRAKGDSAVFYVGKGRGERALVHGQFAVRFDGEEKDSPRLHRIKQIRADGSELLTRVIARVDTEAEALRIEAVLIDWMYGKDKLTNRVSGHSHEHVRGRGDLSVRARLDVPARSGERTGEYSAALGKKNQEGGTVVRLNQWRDQLRELGFDVGPVDTSNVTAYKIVLKLEAPFALHLVARPSNNKVVKLLLRSSSPDVLNDFVALAEKPGVLEHLKDQRVNDRSSKKAYFYLKDFVQAEDNDTDRVSAAITFFEDLITRNRPKSQ